MLLYVSFDGISCFEAGSGPAGIQLWDELYSKIQGLKTEINS